MVRLQSAVLCFKVLLVSTREGIVGKEEIWGQGSVVKLKQFSFNKIVLYFTLSL